MIKFKHDQKTPDGGGSLTVTATTAAEVVAVADHFRMFDKTKVDDLKALAFAINAETLTVTKYKEKRPWFLCSVALDLAFTQPYVAELERVTGYLGRGILDDIDLTTHHGRRLCHTHHTVSAQLEHGHYCAEILTDSEDWNKRSAADNADRSALDYCEQDLGDRKHESEYIPCGNGHSMKANPDYLKRHRCHAALGCDWLWDAIFAKWKAEHATPGQVALIDESSEAGRKNRSGTPFEAKHGRGLDYSGFHVDNWNRHVKWPEFIATA